MTKHKHYDVIVAWAEGREIECKPPFATEWSLVVNPQPNWHIHCEYRIKPHKHQALMDAYANGAKIQISHKGVWLTCGGDPLWEESLEYRIKPPTKKYRLYLYKAMIGYVIGIVEGYQTFNPENMDCFVRWVTDWQEIEIE
jgi:hypothetical protein